MTGRFPPAPNTGKPLLAARASAEARQLLALRRSAGKAFISAPGPAPDELDEILQVAMRVPDHRRVEPWRCLVFEGDARKTAGQMIADVHASKMPNAEEKDLEIERQRFLRAPVVIGVVSSPDKAHKTPVWEQELSAGAVCQNLLLSANAAGWAGVWLSEWIAFDETVADRFGLAENERFAGFIYIGTATQNAPERARPKIGEKISRWTG